MPYFDTTTTTGRQSLLSSSAPPRRQQSRLGAALGMGSRSSRPQSRLGSLLGIGQNVNRDAGYGVTRGRNGSYTPSPSLPNIAGDTSPGTPNSNLAYVHRRGPVQPAKTETYERTVGADGRVSVVGAPLQGYVDATPMRPGFQAPPGRLATALNMGGRRPLSPAAQANRDRGRARRASRLANRPTHRAQQQAQRIASTNQRPSRFMQALMAYRPELAVQMFGAQQQAAANEGALGLRQQELAIQRATAEREGELASAKLDALQQSLSPEGRRQSLMEALLPGVIESNPQMARPYTSRLAKALGMGSFEPDLIERDEFGRPVEEELGPLINKLLDEGLKGEELYTALREKGATRGQLTGYWAENSPGPLGRGVNWLRAYVDDDHIFRMDEEYGRMNRLGKALGMDTNLSGYGHDH